MNFELSDEQRMLEDSIGRLLSDQAAAGVDSAAAWKQFAEFGLPGMAFSEDDGGLGAGPVETMIIMRAIGRSLSPAPYLASAVFGTELLKAVGRLADRAELVAGLCDGSARLAVAYAETGGRGALLPVRAVAVPTGDRFALSGHKTLVSGGDAATHLVVSARLAEGGGIGLFLMPADMSGISVVAYPTVDGRMAADIAFDSVAVTSDALLANPGAAMAALDHAIDHATVATINEAAGAMEAILADTVDYLKSRKQFGLTIGTFQALQHRAVDMFVEVEQAKSMALFATMQLALPDAERRDAIASAKLLVNRACQSVGESAVQLHGAIGMTRECRAGRLFARLTACRVAFGDLEACLAQLLPSTPDILAA